MKGKNKQSNKRSWLNFSFSDSVTSTPKNKQHKLNKPIPDTDTNSDNLLENLPKSVDKNLGGNMNNISGNAMDDQPSDGTKPLIEQIKDLLRETKDEIVMGLNPRFAEIEKRLENLEKPREFDPKFTVVVVNLPFESAENVTDKVKSLFSAMGSDINPTRVKRLRQKNQSHTPIVKAQLKSEEEKISLLRLKPRLKSNPSFHRVYMRSSMSEAELTAFYNMKTLLSVLPPGVQQHIKLQGNGRLTTLHEGPPNPSQPRTHSSLFSATPSASVRN